MKRLFNFLVLFLALGSLMASAEALTPQQALDRVSSLPGSLSVPQSLSNNVGTRARVTSPELLMTIEDTKGEAALYLFDNGENQGYLIVSADEATMPLLGYSDSGSFDPDNIPPALEFWLSEYQNQIEWARENNISVQSVNTRSDVTLPSWAPIAPLVKTSWDQSAPYNNLCPESNGQKCVTGCVATSVAQAMKYFNYPAQGQGSISYETETLSLSLSMDFSKVKFDWNNMLDSYSGSYTSTQATAVATLMEAIGYGVEMDYTTNNSGAASGLVPYALVTYFNYDKGIRYFMRGQFTYTDWATMLYDNLKNIGPVVYNGTGVAGGHSWICDGYQGEGYFHFNWGWGGTSDGYYLLDALAPPALGIGGGGGNFNFNQGAIFNIQPAKSGNNAVQQNTLVLSGGLTGELNGTDLYVFPSYAYYPGWFYTGSSSIQFSLGIGYAPAIGNSDPTFKPIVTAELYGGYYIGPYYVDSQNNQQLPSVSLALSSLNLKKGVKYKIVSAYKPNGGNWQIFEGSQGYPNYFYVTSNGGSSYKIENVTPDELGGSSISLESALVYGDALKVKATITNPSGEELSRGFALALINKNNKVAFIGDKMFVTVSPGGSVEEEWITSLTKQSGIANVKIPTDFYPALYDINTGVVFYTSPTAVTMQPSSEWKATVSIEVEDEPRNWNYPGQLTYSVLNPSNINLNVNVNVTSGTLAQQLYMSVLQSQNNEYAILSYNPLESSYTFLSEGESKTVPYTLNMPTLTLGNLYYLGVFYITDDNAASLISNLTGIYITDAAGVEEVSANSGDIKFVYDKLTGSLNVLGGENGIDNVEAYYSNGIKVPLNVQKNGEAAFVSLQDATNGIIIVTAIDNGGNRKTIKIAK